MIDGGAQCVYVVDSAGALVLGDAQARVAALIGEIGDQAQVGFHGDQNLSLGIANSVLAAQQGALQVDGVLCGLGAGAGNAPTEVLVATFERLGIPTGVDVQGALAAAEDVVRPFLPRLPFADRGAITRGYAGSTPASCCTPSGPRSATACPPMRSCSGLARPATSAGRRT